MELPRIGNHYGPAENYKMALTSSLGDFELVYNYWEDDDIECVTQEIDASRAQSCEYGATGWLQIQLAAAQALKREGFELETCLDDEAFVWQRDA